MANNPDIAIVITTFKRQDLLEVLLQSILDLKTNPAAVFLVDNENSSQTADIAKKYKVSNYIAMKENLGGAGGFSRGIEAAYIAGHEWLWVMDDDVKVLPDALDILATFTVKSQQKLAQGAPLKDVPLVFQPRKYNADGTPFYWQYHFLDKLAIPNPIAKSAFKDDEETRLMNTMCFEGSLINRAVIEQIGLPDARFFIYWDDTMYGYLASKITSMVVVNRFCMARTRNLQNVKIGTVRRLNSTSNITRYYIMRNRGHMAHYLKLNGDYNPFLFWAGTVLTFAKETIRLFVSHEVKSGFGRLVSGMHDAKQIRRDKTWRSYSQVHPL